MNRPFRTEFRSLIALTMTCLAYGCASIGAVDGPSYTPIATIPENNAVIYFYKALGWGRGEFPLAINERVVSVLKKGGYYPYSVKPGTLQITLIEHERKLSDVVKMGFFFGIIGAGGWALIPNTTHTITLEIEAGRTYYVKERDGAAVGLEVVSQELDLDEIAKCKLLPAYVEAQN